MNSFHENSKTFITFLIMCISLILQFVSDFMNYEIIQIKICGLRAISQEESDRNGCDYGVHKAAGRLYWSVNGNGAELKGC